MDEMLLETLDRIASSLEAISFVLVCILFVQSLMLFCKDNNGGFYLRQINDTLKDMIRKLNNNR